MKTFFIVVSLFSAHLATAFPPQDSDDSYQRGTDLKNAGDWQGALAVWLTAKDSLARLNISEARIAFAFVELVAEKEAVRNYEQATEMYYWGVANPDLSKQAVEIRREIDRLAPIAGEQRVKIWVELLKKKDRRLLRELKAFWVRRDPIPTTKTNERLLEHWRRIAHARSKFRQDDNTVYGTDDRGLVFVKYGAPDAAYVGTLGLSQDEIMRWIDDFLLRQEILRFDSRPEYEIWVYSLLPEESSTVFLFGKKRGFGKYGLRYGIEEFLSDRAFSRSSTRMTRGLLPGTLLQLVYYRELMGVRDFYRNRYRELEAKWISARSAGEISPNHDVLKGLVSHYKNLDQKVVRFENLPPDRSNAFEALEQLYLNFKTFRYLDSENRPRLAIIAVSANQTFDPNFVVPFFKRAVKTKYKHRHILIKYDEDWDILEREIVYPDVHNTNTSAFNLLHTGEHQYSLVAEKVILEVRKAELELADLPDTARVIGVQSAFLDPLPPLAAEETSFEVSDLIVGKETPPELTRELSYPFPVITTDPVKSKVIKIYVRFYDLQVQTNRNASCRVQCELKAIKKRGKIDKKKERLKRTFDFESSVRNTAKIFDLDISKLKPGLYELTARIKDQHARQERIRKSIFRIAG
ncbi:MAG: GWxTD domain-containing protein [bacterium]